ncbi:SET domain-containing protein SmydA-8-like isoform X2 [Tigriopus californicus]|uniref:SET domain-containing protein SmydA-8-like isoform X2 n=1 Tax=Tigriopus californicus TaxID=6832 RepID=UPI0027D9F9FE|nr:SET domain-containing protein SmydA-8-like isoform X2 [Tigriopus californicus]
MEASNKYFHDSFPCKISSDLVKGRILLATRDILPGDLVFEEQPLVSGPSMNKNEEPSCLNCMKMIKTGTWSCSRNCEIIFAKTSEYMLVSKVLEHCQDWKTFFDAFLILRCLSLKDENVEQWALITSLDPNHEALSQDKDFICCEDKIVNVIRCDMEQSHHNADEIRLLHRILYINALEYHPHPDEPSGGKALFPITSFASHDCLNNTFRVRTWRKEERHGPVIQTRAKVLIQAGQEVTLHYSGGLKGRWERRKILWEGWCFACQCLRCKSPSELGSHFSTLICGGPGGDGSNCRGNLLPNLDPNLTTLNDVTDYECDFCHSKADGTTVQKLEDQLTKAIESTFTDDIEGLESILDQFGSKFHPQHYLISIVKWLLVNLLGRKPGFANSQMSRARLEGKIKYCQDYLNALDIIDPGISHNRGRTLWEMYSACVFQSQIDFQNQTISKKGFQDSLPNLRQILLEVQRCLRFSEGGSFEAKIVELSQKALISVDEINKFLDMMP